MIVRYGDVQFVFEQTDADTPAGYLKINEGQKKLLATLVDSEKEDWYLDKNGERLPSRAYVGSGLALPHFVEIADSMTA